MKALSTTRYPEIRWATIGLVSALILSCWFCIAYASPNLALNKSVTVSSAEGGNVGSNAVDGNSGTRWSSDFRDPQWIRVDLGSTAAVNRVVLNWEAAYGREYRIQASSNGVDFTDILYINNGDGGFDDLGFAPVQTRYVRLYGIARGTPWGYSLWELEVYVDDESPAAPVVNATSAWSNIEMEARTISGTVEPNATVIPYVEVFGSSYEQTNVQAGGDGNWSAPVNIWGPDGTEFKVYAAARDAAGNWSGRSNEQIIRKDLSAPAAPVVNVTSAWSNVEQEARTISGTAEANATVIPYVEVFGSSYEQTNAQAGPDGTWSATVNIWGPHGTEFKVYAAARDAAGHWSGRSSDQTIRKDLLAPATPLLYPMSPWSTTENEVRIISGRAEPYTTIVPYVSVLGNGTFEQTSVRADTSGSWLATVNLFGPDASEFDIYVQALDDAGNASPRSNLDHVRKDVSAPAAPEVFATSEWSNIENEARTISGVTEPYATVAPFVEVVGIGTWEQANVAADAFGAWSASVNIWGPDATEFHIYGVAKDAAGNVGPRSNALTVRKDLVAPVITIDAVESPTDQDVTLRYTVVDANPTAVTGDNSPYTAEGEHTATLTATDAAGNSSSASITFVIHRAPPPPVDGAAPVTTLSIDLINESTKTAISQSLVTLSAEDAAGEGASGVAAIEFRFDDGAFLNYAGAFTLEGLALGAHTLEYRSRDVAGNVETAHRLEFSVADALAISRQTNEGIAPNLLVWLNYREGKGSNSGKLFADGEDEVDVALLDQVLADAGALSVTKVVSRQDYVKALRSGDYNAYLILGNRSNSKNAGTYDEELRERVRRGEAVVASFWRSGRLADARVEGRSVWGALVRDGKTGKRDLTATFFGGNLVADTLSIQADGKTRRVSLSAKDQSPDVSVIGVVDCGAGAPDDECEDPDGGDDDECGDDDGCGDDGPEIQNPKSKIQNLNQSVAVSNSYHQGRAVYVPFDLGAALTAGNAGQIKDVLRSALTFSRPEVTTVVEGQSVMVSIQVSSPVVDLLTKTEVSLPAQVAVVNTSAGADLGEAGKIKWLVTVAAGGGANLMFTVKFPDGDRSAAAFTTTVSYFVRGRFYPVSNSFIVVVDGGDVDALVQAASADISALAVSGKKDRHYQEKAVRELARIKDRHLDGAGKVRDALRNWKDAVYGNLLRIETADPAALSAIRDRLTTLMLVLERKFVTAAATHGDLASN